MVNPGFHYLSEVVRPLDAFGRWLWAKRAQSQEIVRPVFIIGAERSGTTLLLSILSNHPAFYWLSRLDSVLPRAPLITCGIRRVSRALLPSTGTYVAIRGAISASHGFIPPSECLPYWRLAFQWGDEKDYLIQDDCFTEQDTRVDVTSRIHSDVKMRLSLSNKQRLLVKQPGFSLKVRYLNALFPDAHFIHVIRNPRNNLASLIRAKAESQEKFWGIKIPGWRELVDKDVAYQAAIQLKSVSEIIERDITLIEDWKNRYLLVRYEDLQQEPRATIQTILNSCGLSYATDIDKALQGIEKDTRKQHDATPRHSREVESVIAALSVKYGYA